MSLVDEYLCAMNTLQSARTERGPLSQEEEVDHISKLGAIWMQMSEEEQATAELVIQAGE